MESVEKRLEKIEERLNHLSGSVGKIKADISWLRWLSITTLGFLFVMLLKAFV